MTSREEHLREIADNVRALTSGVRTTTAAERHPGEGEDGVVRRHPEVFTWRLKHPALLLQLTEALIPTGDGGEPTGGGKPGSRAPVAGAVHATLETITTEAAQLRQQMRAECATSRRMRKLTVTGTLLDIRALSLGLGEEWARITATATGRWVGLARTTLGLDAPVATLRDLGCPHCGSRLKVRSDASSDVWCPDAGCRDIDGNRHRWAQPEWPFLLEQLAQQAGEGAA